MEQYIFVIINCKRGTRNEQKRLPSMEYVSSLVSELSWLETLVVVGISVISLYIVKDILSMLLAPPTQPYVAVKREPPVQV